MMKRGLVGLAALLGIAVAALGPSPAQAYWRGGGVYFGFPLFVPPAVVYAPPPVYYAPPPVYYAPQPQYSRPVAQSPLAQSPLAQSPLAQPPLAQPAQRSAPVVYGGTCHAGFYVCRMPQALPVGAQCACPGIGAPSYGSVR